jgi:mRNA interferase RelE/StbE
MAYKLSYTEDALKDLENLDNSIRAMILKWMKKNIEGALDPRVHGKRLSGNLSDYWRYRIGDYRVLAVIEDDKAVVLAVRIRHRSIVYDT